MVVNEISLTKRVQQTIEKLNERDFNLTRKVQTVEIELLQLKRELNYVRETLEKITPLENFIEAEKYLQDHDKKTNP